MFLDDENRTAQLPGRRAPMRAGFRRLAEIAFRPIFLKCHGDLPGRLRGGTRAVSYRGADPRTADGELLLQQAFDLYPRKTPPLKIDAAGFLADDAFFTRPARVAPTGNAVLALIIGPANAIGPGDEFAQQFLSLQKGNGSDQESV